MKHRNITLALTTLALAAASFAASAQSFSNSSVINISGESDQASPYPSLISVSGITGNVSAVTVALNGLTHPDTHDLDILLVGPAGQQVVLMSEAGYTFGATNVALTFSSSAASALQHGGPVTSGTWQPSDYDGTDMFPAPAPANTGNTSLTVFNGPASNANGTWSLYVRNDATWGPLDSGDIAGGWTINITAEVTTTCASEGYTGTKLTWCKNICEKGYTGATLDMWIHRWINRYRDLPYCAVEEAPEEEEQPQDT